MDINVSLCIDEGCVQTVPESNVFDNTNALYIMEETTATATIPSKIIRTATLESGVAGQALVDSLCAEGKTDKQIDSEYPGLLVPADYYYVAPAVITNAYFNLFVYTVYNDEGLVVSGEEMILFLESKNAPEQLIYEIVNGLPLSPTPSYLLNGDEGGSDHDYKDIAIDVEATGAAEVSTTMGVTTVKVNGEVTVKVSGNVGQLQDGGEALVNKVAETFEEALNTVVETAEENANSGPSISVKVTIATAKVVGWVASWF